MEEILIYAGLEDRLKKDLDPEKFDVYKQSFTSALESHSHGANLEKIHTSDNMPTLFSMRYNQKIRFILSKVTQGTKQIWLWLNVLEDHKYEKIARMGNKWLPTKNEKLPELPIAAESSSTASKKKPAKPKLNFSSVDVEYNNNQFIVFDSFQQKAKDDSLPCLIRGAPGSGKTSLGLSLLRKWAQQASDNPIGRTKQFLYVAQSEALVVYMQQEWNALVDLFGIDTKACTVSFKTPKDLFIDYYKGRVETPELVGQDYFLAWFKKENTKKLKKLSHNLSPRKKYIPSAEEALVRRMDEHEELVYQEFRTISGYDSFEQYDNNVGKKHSLFADREERDWLWKVYQLYLEELKAGSKADLFFHPVQSNFLYDAVVCDEAQDVSRNEHLSFKNIVVDEQIAFCFGDHQQCWDSRSIIPFIHSMFWSEGKANRLKEHVLKASYRCPPSIIEFANAFLQFKYHVSGGANNNELDYVFSSDAERQGSLHWLETEDDLHPLINDRTNVDFAIITSPEYVAEAEKRFGAGRVYTAEKIKGLQFKHILFYKFLDSEAFKSAEKVIAENFQLHRDPNDNKESKSSQSSIIHNTAFNGGFVAATRAEESISVFQPKTHGLGRTRELLNNFIMSASQNIAHPQAIPTKSSAQEIQKRIDALNAQGQGEKAQQLIADLALRANEKVESPVTRKEKGKEVLAIPALMAVEKKSEEILNFGIIGQGDVAEIKKMLLLPNAKEILFQTTTKKPFSLFRKLISDESLAKSLHKALTKQIESFISGKDQEQITHFLEVLCTVDPKNHDSLLRFFLSKNTNEHVHNFLKENILEENLLKIAGYIGEYAVKNTSLTLLEKLHRLINFNKVKVNDQLILHYAVLEKNMEVVRKLCTFDIDFALRDHGKNALNIAVESNFEPAIKFFEEVYFTLVKLDPISPLFSAAQNGDVYFLRGLHKRKYNLNMLHPNGSYPTHVAAREGHAM